MTQFSLRAMLIATTIVALLLILPHSVRYGLTLVVWYTLPGVLVAVAVHGNDIQRMFAISALASLAAITWGSQSVPPLLGFIAMGISGGLGVFVQRQLTRQPPRPSPPPPQP